MRTDLGLGKSPPTWRTLTRNCVKLAYKISRLMRVDDTEADARRCSMEDRGRQTDHALYLRAQYSKQQKAAMTLPFSFATRS
eukprot:scaffold88433_cov61-Cyclotella_meneghiniana.AAC.1